VAGQIRQLRELQPVPPHHGRQRRHLTNQHGGKTEAERGPSSPRLHVADQGSLSGAAERLAFCFDHAGLAVEASAMASARRISTCVCRVLPRLRIGRRRSYLLFPRSCVLRKRTPGPPPFSSRNSTPAFVSTRSITASDVSSPA